MGVLVGGGTPLNLWSKPISDPFNSYHVWNDRIGISTHHNASSIEFVLRFAGKTTRRLAIQIASNEEIQVQGSPLFLGYWNGSFIEDQRIQMDGLAQRIAAL